MGVRKDFGDELFRFCARGALLLLATIWSGVAATPTHLPVISLSAGGYDFTVEVAATPEARERGLMFRERLPDDHGMLFVFEARTRPCFWMKNTAIPLTVAFIDASGQILHVVDMEPFSLKTHCSPVAVKYALEMPKGWLAKREIAPGGRVYGLKRASSF